MTDIKIGDVCTYSYNTTNRSLCIVEVVKELSDEVVVVKFHQVIVDDSGNGFFTYLLNSGSTMNVSRKYLHRIELIAQQQSEIKELETEIDKQYEQAVADITGNIADGGASCHLCLKVHIDKAIKEFTEKLKGKAYPFPCAIGVEYAVPIRAIKETAEEMVGAKVGNR